MDFPPNFRLITLNPFSLHCVETALLISANQSKKKTPTNVTFSKQKCYSITKLTMLTNTLAKEAQATHHKNNIFMIYSHFPQNFVVVIYAPFPPICLCSKVDFVHFMTSNLASHDQIVLSCGVVLSRGSMTNCSLYQTLLHMTNLLCMLLS